MKCDCEDFEAGIKAVNGPHELQSARSGFNYQFPQEYVFKFCPWCGARLHEEGYVDEPMQAFIKLTDEIGLEPL